MRWVLSHGLFNTLVLLPIYFVYSSVIFYQTFTRSDNVLHDWLFSTPLEVSIVVNHEYKCNQYVIAIVVHMDYFIVKIWSVATIKSFLLF